MSPKKFSVIFDFDGVIAGSMDLISFAVKEILADYKVEFEDGQYAKKHAGKIIDEAILEELNEARIILNETQKLKINQKLNSILKQNLDEKVEEIEGTKDFIVMLKNNGVDLAIGSGSEKWFIQKILQKFELSDYFQNITSSTEKEIQKGKPAPDTFLLTAKRLNQKPENCLVIEDGIAGMQGAKKAKMKVIALNQKNTNKNFPADLMVDNLSQISFNEVIDLFRAD